MVADGWANFSWYCRFFFHNQKKNLIYTATNCMLFTSSGGKEEQCGVTISWSQTPEHCTCTPRATWQTASRQLALPSFCRNRHTGVWSVARELFLQLFSALPHIKNSRFLGKLIPHTGDTVHFWFARNSKQCTEASPNFSGGRKEEEHTDTGHACSASASWHHFMLLTSTLSERFNGGTCCQESQC